MFSLSGIGPFSVDGNVAPMVESSTRRTARENVSAVRTNAGWNRGTSRRPGRPPRQQIHGREKPEHRADRLGQLDCHHCKRKRRPQERSPSQPGASWGAAMSWNSSDAPQDDRSAGEPHSRLQFLCWGEGLSCQPTDTVGTFPSGAVTTSASDTSFPSRRTVPNATTGSCSKTKRQFRSAASLTSARLLSSVRSGSRS